MTRYNGRNPHDAVLWYEPTFSRSFPEEAPDLCLILAEILVALPTLYGGETLDMLNIGQK
jgi:hypothetical protein